MTNPYRIIIGDVIDGLRTLDAGSVHCCVSSPPYWGLRDYGVDGQIGLEKTPEEYVAKMVDVFRCGAGCVPCVVLDPFLGSGTTVAVARELGRFGVGCELNPEYAALARERIGKAERPATFRSEKTIDSPLFTEQELPQ